MGLAFRDGNNDSVFPLSPIQILWANMVTASLPAIGLGLEVGGPEIMKRKPHNLKDGIFSKMVICDLCFYGEYRVCLLLNISLHQELTNADPPRFLRFQHGMDLSRYLYYHDLRSRKWSIRFRLQ